MRLEEDTGSDKGVGLPGTSDNPRPPGSSGISARTATTAPPAPILGAANWSLPPRPAPVFPLTSLIVGTSLGTSRTRGADTPRPVLSQQSPPPTFPRPAAGGPSTNQAPTIDSIVIGPNRKIATMDEAIPGHKGILGNVDPTHRWIHQVKVPVEAIQDGHIVLLRLHGKTEKTFRYFVLRVNKDPKIPGRWFRMWIGSYNGRGRADHTIAHGMQGGMANMYPIGTYIWKGVAYPRHLPWVVPELSFAQYMNKETLVSNFGTAPVKTDDLEVDLDTGEPFFRVVGRVDTDNEFFNSKDAKLSETRKRLADEGTKKNSKTRKGEGRGRVL